MITTVCMNPAFDKTVTVDTLRAGRVNRAGQSRMDVGGKGVNVAIVARRLGLEAQCVGCAGEDGADRFRAMLDVQGLPHQFLTVPGTLRTNLKIMSTDGSEMTEINEAGAAVNQKTLETFFEMAKKAAKDSVMAVVTGSLPPECPTETYRDLIRMMDVPCILDVSGQELMLGLEAGPCLIKPNIHELASTLGRPVRTLQEIVYGARALMARGARQTLVSMGGEGAVLVTAQKAFYAPAIPVPVASTVGAGDSMVGGWLRGMDESGGDPVEAFRWSVAAATASVMTEGTQLVRPEDIQPLLRRVEIQEV